MNDLINIENKILVIRGQQVMLDRDLAELYGVETKRINEQVRRNIERFPEQFCFQLTKQESVICSKSQIATLNERGNLRGTNIKKYPYVFTEQGVAMLSAVLRSKIAISVSIKIMNAFVLMRHYFQANLEFEQRLDSLERHKIETDNKFDTLFSLIDNYIDFTVLERLTKKQPGVDVTIFTKSDTPITKLEINKFNKQYPTLTITHTSSMHDRFLIIDNTEIYHIGASIKDLGKKCFAFTKLEDAKSVIKEVLQRI